MAAHDVTGRLGHLGRIGGRVRVGRLAVLLVAAIC